MLPHVLSARVFFCCVLSYDPLAAAAAAVAPVLIVMGLLLLAL